MNETRTVIEPPPRTDDLRLFVAVDLPSETRRWCKDALDRARRALGPAETAVRWVRPEGVHVTLKFLGSVDAMMVPRLVEQLNAAVAGQAAFDLAIGPLGVFPGPRAPRVIWLALVGGLAGLGDSQARVEATTVPLGFAPESRPFQPHLTIGRVRENASTEQRVAIGRLPATWPTDASPAFRVSSVSLMRSELGPGGARYTQIKDLPLS